ncbi:MAG: hypothetical protein V7677_19365 [Motiliproteus sp.]
MHEYKFNQVDVKALTFNGLSAPLERKVAMWASLLILVGVSSFLLATAMRLNLTPDQNIYAMAIAAAMLAHYAWTGRVVLKDLATWLGGHTPVSILYNRDKRILSRAREELLLVAGKTDLRGYLHYRKINPAIGSKRHLLVLAHQRKGDLRPWTEKSTNLKILADLVYQLHLAEQVVAVDHQQAKDSLVVAGGVVN